jgi:cobalt-zinc-cadmium efflux system protein
MFDGVPDSVDLAQVHACLLSRPGVSEVHDLHVWAMSTSHIALTAHLVMPNGHPGDAFFNDVAHVLHDRFDIDHPTLQIELSRLEHGCAQPALISGGRQA